MNLFDIFEGAIDDLEARRIEDLNAKMDDLTARAKSTSDPRVKEALRHEFARAKAERDSYYKINVDEEEIDEHGGGGGGPAQWHNYVRSHRTNEEEVDEHGGGVNGMKNYISWRKNANKERGITKAPPPVGKSAPSKLPTIPKGTVHGKLDQSRGVVPKASFDEEIDTNYTYTVFIDGTKEGTYGSKEEAKAVVRRKKEQAPGRDYRIAPKLRTSMRSIKKFQRSHEVDEGIIASGPSKPLDDRAVKKLVWDTMKINADSGEQALQRALAVLAKKPQSRMVQDLQDKFQNLADRLEQGIAEGFQDFNKVEPYAVCLAGKPVKKFDYYEEARRFHDNWKQKLYREGNKEKADKITLMPLNLDEAANPAQQAAIAINMKKHHQKPKQVDEDYGSWIVYDPATKEIKKRFKTHTAGKSYAKVHNLGFASSEYYFDNVKEKAVAEGAKVDRMQKHIASSEKDLGHSKKDAEAIGWATLNKRGYLDNKNKKTNESFEKVPTEKLQALWNQHKDEQRPNPAFAQHLRLIAKELARRKEVEEGWKSNLAGAALVGATALGSGAAQARVMPGDDPGINRLTGKPNIEQPATADTSVEKPAAPGFSKTYLQSVANGTHPRPMISKEKAQELLSQMDEASMDWASHKSTGPKFSGYLKGTDPAPTEYGNKSFGSESEEMEEGIAGNMTVKSAPITQPLRQRNFVAKNAIQSGAGKHANQLKKAAAAGRHAKHKGQPLDLDEGDNFLTWAVRNGYNLSKPAVYESARNTYKALVEDCGPIAPHETYYGAMDESLKQGEYYVWTVYFDDGSSKRIKVTSDEFDPYEYYAKQKKNVINVDYNWEIQQ